MGRETWSRWSWNGGPCDWFDNDARKTMFSACKLTNKSLVNILLKEELRTVSADWLERKLKCLGQVHSCTPSECWCSEWSAFSTSWASWWWSAATVPCASSAWAWSSTQQHKVSAKNSGIGNNTAIIFFIFSSFALGTSLVNKNIL